MPRMHKKVPETTLHKIPTLRGTPHRKKYKQNNRLSSKVSSSRQIPSYQTNTTSKLNEYINKYKNMLTLPYSITM